MSAKTAHSATLPPLPPNAHLRALSCFPFLIATVKLHNKMEDLKGKIRVYVRVRPFSQKERARGCKETVEAQGKQTIAVQDPRVKEEKTFDFDQVSISERKAEPDSDMKRFWGVATVERAPGSERLVVELTVHNRLRLTHIYYSCLAVGRWDEQARKVSEIFRCRICLSHACQSA